MMSINRIRALAICVFRHNGRILVAEGVDPCKGGQVFYRPLGGGIEFGEYAKQTLVRELREELDAEITALRFLRALSKTSSPSTENRGTRSCWSMMARLSIVHCMSVNGSTAQKARWTI